MDDIAARGTGCAFMDSPPEASDVAVVAALEADLVAVPATPSAFDLWAASDAADATAEAAEDAADKAGEMADDAEREAEKAMN